MKFRPVRMAHGGTRSNCSTELAKKVWRMEKRCSSETYVHRLRLMDGRSRVGCMVFTILAGGLARRCYDIMPHLVTRAESVPTTSPALALSIRLTFDQGVHKCDEPTAPLSAMASACYSLAARNDFAHHDSYIAFQSLHPAFLPAKPS
jgi:hypothetical protein